MIHKFKCQLFEVIIDDVEMTIENPYLVDRLLSKGDFYNGKYFKFTSAGSLQVTPDTLYFKGDYHAADGKSRSIINFYILNRLVYDLSECCKKYPLKTKSHLPKWF